MNINARLQEITEAAHEAHTSAGEREEQGGGKVRRQRRELEERAEKEYKRWDMLHKKRLTRETLKAFKEGRRITGVLAVVSMYKKAGQGDNGGAVPPAWPLDGVSHLVC